MNVKRNKTVNSFKKNNLVLDSLHTSNFEKESVVNITINSHMKNKRNNSKNSFFNIKINLSVIIYLLIPFIILYST